jgi:hypothetical protein
MDLSQALATIAYKLKILITSEIIDPPPANSDDAIEDARIKIFLA